jgi:hypothetical protein
MTLEQYMQCLALHAHDDDDMDEALPAGRKRLLTDLTNAERCVQRAPIFIGRYTISISNMLSTALSIAMGTFILEVSLLTQRASVPLNARCCAPICSFVATNQTIRGLQVDAMC